MLMAIKSAVVGLVPFRLFLASGATALSFSLLILPSNAVSLRFEIASGVLGDTCTINPTGGALGFSSDRKIISTDQAALGSGYLGNPQAASISVESNLVSGSGASVNIDSPVLSGGNSYSEASVRTTGSYGPTASIGIPSSGILGNAELHVKFTNGNSFGNDSYTVATTLTCTDDGHRVL